MTDPVRIADIIEKLVGNGKFLIRGEKEKELRPVRYSDFMVITYGKKKLGPIMAELDGRNIPTKVEGDVPFAANRALYELGLIYAAAADADKATSLKEDNIPAHELFADILTRQEKLMEASIHYAIVEQLKAKKKRKKKG